MLSWPLTLSLDLNILRARAFSNDVLADVASLARDVLRPSWPGIGEEALRWESLLWLKDLLRRGFARVD